MNLNVSESVQIELDFRGCSSVKLIKARTLQSEDLHDHNTFEDPTKITPQEMEAEMPTISLAPASVNVFEFTI